MNIRSKNRNLLLTLLILFWITPSVSKALSLREAINEALKKNFLIKQRMETVSASKEQKKIVKTLLLPKLSSSYSYQRLKERPYALFENPLLPEEKYRVHLGDRDRTYWNITITQPIFTGFSLITRYRIASLGIDLSKEYRHQAELNIVKEVKTSYFQVLLSKRYVQIAKEEVAQLKSHYHDAKLFFKQGIIPYNDLLKSEVALARAKQRLVKAKSNLRVAISKLNTVLERQIDESTQIEDIGTFVPKSYNLEQLYQQALKRRPEIRALKIAIKQAEQKIRLAKSGYYPSIYLVARYEQTGTDLGATENDYGNTKNASIGIQAKWNIFEWGKTKAEVRKAEHEYRQLCYELKETEQMIKLEVKSAFEELKVAVENLETAKTALKQAKENYRITELRYKENLTTSTEVLDARTYLTEAEVNYYDALYGYMIAKAKLEYSIAEEFSE